jgi:hypothetical protein
MAQLMNLEIIFDYRIFPTWTQTQITLSVLRQLTLKGHLETIKSLIERLIAPSLSSVYIHHLGSLDLLEVVMDEPLLDIQTLFTSDHTEDLSLSFLISNTTTWTFHLESRNRTLYIYSTVDLGPNSHRRCSPTCHEATEHLRRRLQRMGSFFTDQITIFRLYYQNTPISRLKSEDVWIDEFNMMRGLKEICVDRRSSIGLLQKWRTNPQYLPKACI